MVQKLKKIGNWLLPMAGIALAVLAMTGAAHAQSTLGGGWDQFLKNTGLKTFSGTNTVAGEELAGQVIRRAIRLVRYGVGAVAVLFGILYGSLLVFSRGNEEAISKQKRNFLWAFLGFAILMAGEGIAAVFNPEQATSEKLIDFTAARDQLRNIADYLKWMLGSVLVLLMTLSGIRLVAAGGDEEKIKKEKQNLIYSMMGMMVMLLASNLVNAFYVINTGTLAAPSNAASTLGNVLRFLLLILGPAAIVFTLYAGFLYLTAFDNEEQTKKASRMIVGGVTGIVLVYAAYALVNTFFTAPALTQITP